MKVLVAATALLFILQSSLSHATDNDAQQLVISAIRQSSLFRNQNSAFQLDADFSAQAIVPMQGSLTLKWASAERWWRKITLGKFEQVEVRSGDKLYTSRNLPFTPMQVRELIGLILFADRPEPLRVKKQKQRSENGVNLVCFRMERVKGNDHEFCLNSMSHDPVSDEWEIPPDEHRTERFADYFDVEGRRFPRKLELLVNGVKTITVNVNQLAETSFDESLLVPPKGAIERRQCAEMARAKPIKTPDPAYPKSARQNNMMGDTTVAMTILADGTVGNIQVIGNVVRSMDEATLQTLKGWRFKPAMCGAEPVVSDIEVKVSFRLN